jgi:prevent-host-death family protein
MRTTKDTFPKGSVFETMSGIGMKTGTGVNMQAISATDTKLKLATLLNRAEREPVMIVSNDRDIAVMLSATEYQRLSDRPRARASHPPIDPKLVALLDACD